MAKKSMILKQQAPAKFSTRPTTAARSAAAPTRIFVTTSASASCVQGRDPRRSQGFLLIFFRYTSLKLLGVHKVRRRRFASSNEKISRRTCC